MIESGDSKVVVDALFGGFQADWCYVPPDSIVGKMRLASSPFDDIDLIAVTHVHRDHFVADIVRDHLRHNSKAVIVCPPQVEDKLRQSERYAEIQDRVRSVLPPQDSVVRFTVGNIDLRVLIGPHLPYYEEDAVTGEPVDRHRDVQNLEFLFTIAGRTVYHCGDADMNDRDRYFAFGFGEEPVDLALVPWWDARDQLSFQQKLVKDIIRPKAVILMHMSPPRPPRGHPERRTDVAGRVIVPREPLERWVF
jgi:L-ascorbate metabolism protein UlaG (beta-lactamase superfamily)